MKCACCDSTEGHESYCHYEEHADWGRGLYSMNGPWPRPRSDNDCIWVYGGDGYCLKMKPGNGADGWIEAGVGRIIAQ
jgi:hypothetical protein